MSLLRTIWRTALLLALIVLGLLMAVLVTADLSERLDCARMAGWWHRRLLAVLGIRVQRHGTPVDGAHLSIANHISWLDIPVMNACEPVRFVAKSEIRNWPLAGWLATAAGSFYLRRGRGDASRVVDRLTTYLRNGGSVALFPEGTTTTGRQVQRFHARMFAPAIDARCVVQPIALRYLPVADGRDVAPFVGDDDLFRHLLRVLREPRIDVELTYCAPLEALGRERTELAAAAQAAIEDALGLPPDLRSAGVPLAAAA
ncbi:lysophospholipid acyltransferase family protein [Solimonas marina]|uniref:1-acyl-sn-glycerol-3-phosphate acyltransferase n=1 Tax=Solimonas marina TaxID=2714601 RepID=A0A970BA06_9GAMM|nr:lysophospholipid acyltransferase family protein [Solimonas marina]NKF22896.1 1-acyl-sn-glycerol-3-phosphate acyltransferase [Solimonas marina]